MYVIYDHVTDRYLDGDEGWSSCEIFSGPDNAQYIAGAKIFVRKRDAEKFTKHLEQSYEDDPMGIDPELVKVKKPSTINLYEFAD